MLLLLLLLLFIVLRYVCKLLLLWLLLLWLLPLLLLDCCHVWLLLLICCAAAAAAHTQIVKKNIEKQSVLPKKHGRNDATDKERHYHPPLIHDDDGDFVTPARTPPVRPFAPTIARTTTSSTLPPPLFTLQNKSKSDSRNGK